MIGELLGIGVLIAIIFGAIRSIKNG